ncbi:MAG TPA: hypothetical protein VHZ49_18300 [Methylomirabilota bacterium]|jgi:two-component system chemotaxis response regulator CheB|nr:hypothetical protein [Methylomirabilota bacterium]
MTLPLRIPDGRQPALVCPDCGGAISVNTEGAADYLVFTCQVGHAYSAATLIAGKEERVEQALWSAIYLLEELARLLGSLAERGGPDGRQPSWPAARQRIEQLRTHAAAVRRVLDDEKPIDLCGGTVAERDPS